jgi:hypothetical protein
VLENRENRVLEGARVAVRGREKRKRVLREKWQERRRDLKK